MAEVCNIQVLTFLSSEINSFCVGVFMSKVAAEAFPLKNG